MLNIPVVAMIDTNANPDVVDVKIPANDDAIRAVRLITAKMADAIVEVVKVKIQHLKMHSLKAMKQQNQSKKLLALSKKATTNQ